MKRPRHAALYPITARQQEVADMVAKCAYDKKEAAKRLGCGKTYVVQVMKAIEIKLRKQSA